jgi:hypothetical protein
MALGLAGETGGLAEHIKNLLRDGKAEGRTSGWNSGTFSTRGNSAIISM